MTPKPRSSKQEECSVQKACTQPGLAPLTSGFLYQLNFYFLSTFATKEKRPRRLHIKDTCACSDPEGRWDTGYSPQAATGRPHQPLPPAVICVPSTALWAPPCCASTYKRHQCVAVTEF